MVASPLSSPLCTWFVAACMSVACGRDNPSKSSLFQHSKLLGKRSHFKKLISKFSCNGCTPHSCNLFPTFDGLTLRNLVCSRLSFEPREEFYNFSERLPSLSFFGDNVRSLFGSKAAFISRWQSSGTDAAIPGSIVAVAEKTEKEDAMRKSPPKQTSRVVVTGLGVVSSVGQDVDEFYNNLLDGVSGISEIQGFECAQFPTKIAGEIKSFSADGWVSPKISRKADKFMIYLLTAGKKALADAGITERVMKELDKTRAGVLIGSALGGMKIFTDGVEALRVSYKKMNPFCIPFSTTNMGSAILAMDLGWMGPNYSISSACATSNFCILNAANHIIRGETDLMLCGGSDAAILPVGLGGLIACTTLSRRNNDPTKASRPWDADRDGFVLGEGAGVLLLEDLEHAKKRGAKIYAEFLGGSFTCDAYHMTEPHPDGTGIVLCLEQALAQSGVSREDVNYINAHASSTQTGDLSEYRALVHCFGSNPELKINSTKSMIGHLIGASGAVEAVATVKAIQTRWVHPNVNLENPDKAVDMRMIIGSKKEQMKIKVFNAMMASLFIPMMHEWKAKKLCVAKARNAILKIHKASRKHNLLILLHERGMNHPSTVSQLSFGLQHNLHCFCLAGFSTSWPCPDKAGIDQEFSV